MKSALIILSLLLLASCDETASKPTAKNQAVPVQLTPIQQERAEMHEKFENNIRHLKIEKKLKHLCRKSFNESTSRQAEKRIQYSWRLGNLEQLKTDIPEFLNSKPFKNLDYPLDDWRLLLKMSEHSASEWSNFREMADELYDYFKKVGDVESEQKMLGVKIQGAHLMADFINEKKYLLQMLDEIGQDDERYKEYHSRLGWWYQDRGQWDESIKIFKEQYEIRESKNMLSSLIWGLFNNDQFDEVIKYENKVSALKERKINYIFAKSYEELGRTQKANYYYEKFSKQDYMGSRVNFYFTDLKTVNNKFYLSDHAYLIQVAEYFSSKDPDYSCRLNKHIYERIYSAIKSDYPISIEREIILAQNEPEQQEIQNEKYLAKRKGLFNELRRLREICRLCETQGF